MDSLLALIRGGGDLASGVALRLHRAGIGVIITELPQPLAVRRLVSFAEAVFSNEIEIEGVIARLAKNKNELPKLLEKKAIPVIVDPMCGLADEINPHILIDARMTKQRPELSYPSEWFSIGLGPGFSAGENCDAVIETKRGHFLGRVYWQGTAETDTGVPESVSSRAQERVLRAPKDGLFHSHVTIGQSVQKGELIAEVGGQFIVAPFQGIVRGLLHDGLPVTRSMKIGDLDPRNDPRLSSLVSDKSLAVGGGVLEAILSIDWLRKVLCAAG